MKNLGTTVTLEELRFSVRTYNCLKRAGINTLKEIENLSEDDMMRIRNLGRKSVEEIRVKLAEQVSTSEDIMLERNESILVLEVLQDAIKRGSVVNLTKIQEFIQQNTNALGDWTFESVEIVLKKS